MKFIYIHTLKRKLKVSKKYSRLYLNLTLFLLNIALVNLITNKIIRNSNNHDSIIRLVIQGGGDQKILSDVFYQKPFAVYVNDRYDSWCDKRCNLGSGENDVTLKFNDDIDSCEYMFEYLDNITEVDLSDFDASKVTSMYRMFYGCSNLTKIKFGNINTQSLKDMESLFEGCSKLISVDLSKFDTSKVTTMNSMFYEWLNLVEINLGNIDTSSLENMEYLFCDCSKLVSIDISNFNTSKVTTMFCLFCYSKKLENINLGNINMK